MKKIVLTLLLCVLLGSCAFALVSCGGASSEPAADTAGKTEPATEAATAAPTDAVTEAATAAPTDAATEAATAVPTDAATEAVTDPATEPATTASATEPIDIGVIPNVRTAGNASITFSPSIGLRYSGFVDKESIDALKDAYGADSVKVGLLVTPTENLTAHSLDFTVEALDACEEIVGEKYVQLTATLSESSSSDSYTVNCIMTGLEEQEYTCRYSTVFYVEVKGRILCYSTYLESTNSRSLSEVAEAAYLDFSDSKTGKYRNEVNITADIVKYSPYTPAQRETLMNVCYPHSFTVMSYNIAVYDSPSGGAGWEGRDPAKVAETILSESPDIVGLQEVNQKGKEGWDATLAALAESGGYTRLEGHYTRDGFEKNEIFFKTDKFTKVSEGTNTFKQTASDLDVKNTEGADNSLDKHDRVFHYAVLEEIETGRKILVVNTHLHYGGTGSGHEEDDKVRRLEIRTLLTWLERMSKNYPDQIVLGDLNAHYNPSVPNNGGTLTMKVFFDGGFERTSDTAKIKGDLLGTLPAKNRTERDTRYTFDYVLTKGAFTTVFYTAVDNPIDAGNTYPSDHIPVMARISLR